MKHDGKIESFPLRGQFFINKKSDRQQLLHNNHKNISRPKGFNENKDTSNTAPPQATIDIHRPKANSINFEDPYDHIKPMYMPIKTPTVLIHKNKIYRMLMLTNKNNLKTKMKK